MKIACRCENCANIFMQEEDDIMIMIDFKSKNISFICRNPKCKKENVLDFKQWQDNAQQSPLPKMRVGRW